MCVAVVKGIVSGFPVLGTVIGIRSAELLAEVFDLFGIIFVFEGEIISESHIVVIADRHHKRNMLDYTFHTVEKTCPLNIGLSAVCVIARSENKSHIGVKSESFPDNLVQDGIIGRRFRTAALSVRKAKKLKALKVGFRCFEIIYFTSEIIVSAGIFVFLARLKGFDMCPKYIAAVHIGVKAYHVRICSEPIFKEHSRFQYRCRLSM